MATELKVFMWSPRPLANGLRLFLEHVTCADIRRRYWILRRDTEVLHARERAVLAAWRVEVEHFLAHGDFS